MPFLDGSLTQRLSVVDSLASQSLGTGTTNGATVDMLYFERIMYIVNIGALGGGSVVAQLQYSPDTTTWTTISAKTSTSVSSGSLNILKIAATSEDLATAATASRYVRIQIVVSTASVQVAFSAVATVGRFKPENKFNEITTVTQTINDTN